MSLHVALVSWSSDDPAAFAKGRYGRGHQIAFDGGTTVRGSASPVNVPPGYAEEAAVDPEELFVASLSACHMLWFLDFARRDGWAVAHYRDAAEGVLGLDADGRMAMTRVTLRPEVLFAGDGPDAAALTGLHHRAHAACFIANSAKTEVVVES